MEKIKRIIRKYRKLKKQLFCDHAISENQCEGGCTGPKIWHNYTTYHCMLCGKQIKFLGRAPLESWNETVQQQHTSTS